ncbi:hypothetical protein niasHT_023807 [Heterodera trifolii]|uniref:Uncharacterized protein n=1 Tax=Heterodera trifolii TaxID=157864 RepID=A0ABD2JRR6_9BILA
MGTDRALEEVMRRMYDSRMHRQGESDVVLSHLPPGRSVSLSGLLSTGGSHYAFVHPPLAVILDDVDKQVDIARSARVFPHKRRIKTIG